MIRPQDLIQKKRDREVLSRDEIAQFVHGVTNGTWADYQSSALLMAIFLNGMNDAEQQSLTEEMLLSGETLDFSEIALPKADKHSTGGVGDKTSLVIAPLAAACGLCVPMISGRGLGHTGGTLDKLEAIPGYRVRLSLHEFREILKDVGYAMTGQSADIAPADKKLYALRDATATVEAIPLIVASIMSKKLAAGLDALVLDVKTGNGAFMREESRARELACALVKTGNSFGVRTEALLTDMNQPLGRAIGNALETHECITIMRGEADARAQPVTDLAIELTTRMLTLAGVHANTDDARACAKKTLSSGKALERFRKNVEAQGGDPRVCDDPSQLIDLKLREVRVESPRAGFVVRIDTSEIGNAIAAIGGGRIRIEDNIDPAVGFLSDVKLGQQLDESNKTLGLLYCRNETQAAEASARIQAAFELSDEQPASNHQLIKEVITE